MQAAVVRGQDTIPTRRYRPDGGFTVAGVMQMAAVLLLAGIALGVAGHYTSRAIWLILLFPVGIGLTLGWAARRMVRAVRVRNPAIAGVLGFVAGLAAISMMHYQDYRGFRSLTSDIPREFRRIAQLPESERKAQLHPDLTPDEATKAAQLIELAAVNDMLDYMNWQARQGLRIGNIFRSTGSRLGYTETWIYWLVEVFLVAGVAYGVARSAASEPYCTACEQWKPCRLLGYFTGSAQEVQAAISNGSVAALRDLGPVADQASLALHVAQCPRCGASDDVQLKLEMVTVGKKEEKIARILVQHTTTASSIPVLESLLASTAAPPAPPPNSPTPAPTLPAPAPIAASPAAILPAPPPVLPAPPPRAPRSAPPRA